MLVVIYWDFFLDVAQGHMNGAPNDTSIHVSKDKQKE